MTAGFFWKCSVVVALAVALAVPLAAQETSALTTAVSSTLYLKVLDSSTGGGVAPASISVDEQAVSFEVEAGSLIALSLPDGSHSIKVEADGYGSIEVSAAVQGDETPIMEIELDPTEPLEVEPVAADAAVLEGNVSDADTGVLMKDVLVTLPDTQLSTRTDDMGLYSFEIITGVPGAAARPAVTLEVEAEGYQSVRMKNVVVTPGERRRMQIKMDRSTSETFSMEIVETDDRAAPGSHRTSEWTYDVTLR